MHLLRMERADLTFVTLLVRIHDQTEAQWNETIDAECAARNICM